MSKKNPKKKRGLAKGTKKFTWCEYLVAGNKDCDRRTLRKYFDEYCREKGIPYQCAVEKCPFHTKPLIWSGQPFELDLDHANGNSRDNRPGNLRYLCPNCHSQQPTRGGSNRGRVELIKDTSEKVPTGRTFVIHQDDATDNFTHISDGKGGPNLKGSSPAAARPNNGGDEE